MSESVCGYHIDDVPQLEAVLMRLPKRFSAKLRCDIDYILAKEIEGLVAIFLFGSCARNEQRWDSDLDIAIITEQPITDRALRGEIVDVLDWPKDGVGTDVVFRSKKTQGTKYFDMNFRRDAILLWRK